MNRLHQKRVVVKHDLITEHTDLASQLLSKQFPDDDPQIQSALAHDIAQLALILSHYGFSYDEAVAAGEKLAECYYEPIKRCWACLDLTKSASVQPIIDTKQKRFFIAHYCPQCTALLALGEATPAMLRNIASYGGLK